jgi:hypothetical protein
MHARLQWLLLLLSSSWRGWLSGGLRVLACSCGSSSQVRGVYVVCVVLFVWCCSYGVVRTVL